MGITSDGTITITESPDLPVAEFAGGDPHLREHLNQLVRAVNRATGHRTVGVNVDVLLRRMGKGGGGGGGSGPEEPIPVVFKDSTIRAGDPLRIIRNPTSGEIWCYRHTPGDGATVAQIMVAAETTGRAYFDLFRPLQVRLPDWTTNVYPGDRMSKEFVRDLAGPFQVVSVAGVLPAPSAIRVTRADPNGVSLHLVLNGPVKAGATVTAVPYVTPDNGDIVCTPSSVSWTSVTWREARTIKITTQGEGDPEPTGSAVVGLSIDSGADPWYAGLDGPAANLTVTEDDALVKVSPTSIVAPGTYTVSLREAPTQDVLVELDPNCPNINVGSGWGNKRTLTFTPGDYAPKSVTVSMAVGGSGSPDDLYLKQRQFTNYLLHTVTGDPVFAGYAVPPTPVVRYNASVQAYFAYVRYVGPVAIEVIVDQAVAGGWRCKDALAPTSGVYTVAQSRITDSVIIGKYGIVVSGDAYNYLYLQNPLDVFVPVNF